MAQIEQIILNGKSRRGFNVSNTVGLAGKNEIGDVLMIQAMFRYIHNGLGDASFLTFQPLKMPDKTGLFDGDTQNVFAAFLMKNIGNLYRPDGMIHPASYKNRDLNPFKPVMYITLLHVHCRASAKKQGHDDYPNRVMLTTPQLIPWLMAGKQKPSGGLLGAISNVASSGMLGRLIKP